MSQRPRGAPRSFRYLNAGQVEVICRYLIDLYFLDVKTPGELRQVVYRDRLEAALAAPAHTFEGRDLFPTITDKAACLFRSLIKDHPFLDGNKRTAVVATTLFLRINGYRIVAGKGELYQVALRVARSRDNDTIMRYLRRWFRERIRRLRSRVPGRRGNA